MYYNEKINSLLKKLFTAMQWYGTNNIIMKLGSEILLESHATLLEGKRVGILAHAASVDSKGRHIVDLLLEGAKNGNWHVTALFGPEHGIYGKAQDLEAVLDARLQSGMNFPRLKSGIHNNIPIHSLYGETFASLSPAPKMLENIDVMVIDLQDIGSRYYTYAATMALCIRACEAAGKAVIVCDRPNPINGIDVEGGMVDPEFRSFVGMFPIPVRHGMTIGGIAKRYCHPERSEGSSVSNCMNGILRSSAGACPRAKRRGGLPQDDNVAGLHIIPTQGWNREHFWDETGLKWINPSPNMRSLTAALLYPGMCLIEGTNISEGRGTHTPFETIGAPWIDAKELVSKMRSLKLVGIDYEPVVFTPTTRKFANERCEGIQFTITNRHSFKPYLTGLALIYTIASLYPKDFKWRREPYEFVSDIPAIDILTGNGKFRKSVDKKMPFEKIAELSFRHYNSAD